MYHGRCFKTVTLSHCKTRPAEMTGLSDVLCVPAGMSVFVNGSPFRGCQPPAPQLAENHPLKQIVDFVYTSARMGGTTAKIDVVVIDGVRRFKLSTDATSSTAAESKQLRSAVKGLGEITTVEIRSDHSRHVHNEEPGFKEHLKQCTGCGKLVKCKLCSRCKAPFCSDDCIHASWKKHKAYCKAASAQKVGALVFWSSVFLCCSCRPAANPKPPVRSTGTNWRLWQRRGRLWQRYGRLWQRATP